MAFMIKRDGIVTHWARWYLIMIALLTTVFYTVRILGAGILMLISPHPLSFSILDPAFLMLTIPAGILWGDLLYQNDLKENGSKPISMEKEGR